MLDRHAPMRASPSTPKLSTSHGRPSKAQTSHAATIGVGVLGGATSSVFMPTPTLFTRSLRRVRRTSSALLSRLRLLMQNPIKPIAECKQRSPITEAEQKITGLPVNGGVSIASVRTVNNLDVAHDTIWPTKRRHRQLVPRRGFGPRSLRRFPLSRSAPKMPSGELSGSQGLRTVTFRFDESALVPLWVGASREPPSPGRSTQQLLEVRLAAIKAAGLLRDPWHGDLKTGAARNLSAECLLSSANDVGGPAERWTNWKVTYVMGVRRPNSRGVCARRSLRVRSHAVFGKPTSGAQILFL